MRCIYQRGGVPAEKDLGQGAKKCKYAGEVWFKLLLGFGAYACHLLSTNDVGVASVE